MAKRKLPAHIPGTVEQWRRRKRREFRKVLQALNEFRAGVAYTPAYVGVENNRFVNRWDRLEREVQWMREQLRGNWAP